MSDQKISQSGSGDLSKILNDIDLKTESLNLNESEPLDQFHGCSDEIPSNDEGRSNSFNLVKEEDNNDSEYSTPKEMDEKEPFLDDLVDEEALEKDEKSLTDEQLSERFEKCQIYKSQGNDEFGRSEFKESVQTYTNALRICPLREKEFRSILYSNRSASKVNLGAKLGAVHDCTKALENNPLYMRPLLRRAKLYEELDKLDEALADYKSVLEIDSSVKEANIAIQRLPGQINERNEKLKTEMMGKLKDLGNIILKPFGLSTNNFQLQQDPNSGGYSINFKN